MADKKTISLVLAVKNMLGKGLTAGQDAVKAFADKAKGALEGFKNAIFSLPTAIAGVFSGMAARMIVKPAMDLQDYSAQFKVLLGSLESAEKRISDLSDFAASTPFQLPGIIQASKTLETLTQGALSTGDGLRMVGDVAAGTGQPIQELSVWFGRLYDGLKSGRPVGEAMARMQELGIVTGSARAKIEQMTASGASFADMWKVVQQETSRYNGMMDEMSQTASGVVSTLKDNFSLALAEIGKEILPLVIQSSKELTNTFAKLKASGELQAFGKDAAAVLQQLYKVISGIVGFVVQNRDVIASLGFSLAGIKIVNIAVASFQAVSTAVRVFAADMAIAKVQSDATAVSATRLSGALGGLAQIGVGAAIGFLTGKFIELNKAIADADTAARKFNATGDMVTNNTVWGNLKDAFGFGKKEGEVISIAAPTADEIANARNKLQKHTPAPEAPGQVDAIIDNPQIKQAFEEAKEEQKREFEEQIKRITEFYIPELEKTLKNAELFGLDEMQKQIIDNALFNLKRGKGLSEQLINERASNVDPDQPMIDFFNGADARNTKQSAVQTAQMRNWQRESEAAKKKEERQKNKDAERLERAEERMRTGQHLSKKDIELLAEAEREKKVAVAQQALDDEKKRKDNLEKQMQDLQKKTFEAHLKEMQSAQQDRQKMITLLGNLKNNAPINLNAVFKKIQDNTDPSTSVDMERTNSLLEELVRKKITVWEASK